MNRSCFVVAGRVCGRLPAGRDENVLPGMVRSIVLHTEAQTASRRQGQMDLVCSYSVFVVTNIAVFLSRTFLVTIGKQA